MADSKSKADIEKDHATAGMRPVSPTEDPTVHAVDGGASKAAEAEKDKAKLEEDNSLAGKMRKSELFYVRNHVSGENYVGISPQNDPEASAPEKRLSSVTALDSIAPQTGMIVKPKDGDAFTVGDGFGPTSTPADWARVTKPDGSSLFA